MKKAAIAPPSNERQRLAMVQKLRLLGSEAEERFDRIARLAGLMFEMPAAFISLVDADRLWFKSGFGLCGLRETPRENSFCAAIVASEENAPLIVRNAAKDPRFAFHPLVKNGIRFFAGQPLVADGFKVGTLAVMDSKTRRFSEPHRRALVDLALMAEQELRGIPLRKALDQLAAAERRAEEQHARFLAFMDHLPNAAFIKDAGGRLTYVNRRHQQIFGIAGLLGKRDDQWLPAEVSKRTMAGDREVLESGKSTLATETMPTPLGTRHWLTFRFLIPAPDGEKMLGGVSVDITEQKETERQLQQLSALQRAILDSANFSIISVDHEGLVRSFNAASERMLGYRAEEVVLKEKADIWMDKADLQSIAAELSRKSGKPIEPNGSALKWELQSAAVVDYELRFVRKDGSAFPVALSLTELPGAEGEPSGCLGIAQDITARREAQSSMRHAKEAAETANRAKSQFLANMSHEVRTPLNGILGVGAMLLATELKPDQRQLAQIVQSSGEALLSIVNDILDFSKVEAGRVELENINFSLTALLSTVVELNSARASERCLILTPSIAADVPLHLHGDPLRLRQVLDNLTGNAIKFSDHGQVQISVTLEGDTGQNVRLRFTVTDSGIGIPLEKQAHIFEPFTQADVSTTRQFGGTGLGLSICRQLAELMGGRIGVESEPGSGAAFWFSATLGVVSEEFIPPPTIYANTVEPLPPLRVLLAEDNPVNRLVATHQLQQLGCEVETVENGSLALDALAAARFDFVLMDCQMPVMDGYAATVEIRRRESEKNGGGENQGVPIIALTANAMSGEKERCLAIGMNGYLSKPFTAAALRTLITSLLSNSAVPLLDNKTLSNLRLECRELEEDHFPTYVAMFQEDSSQLLKDLDVAEANCDIESLRRIAHRLRGGAANFGALGLMQLCTQCEAHAIDEQLAEAIALLPSLRVELLRVQQALADLSAEGIAGDRL